MPQHGYVAEMILGGDANHQKVTPMIRIRVSDKTVLLSRHIFGHIHFG
jgi:hypothetical protein